MIYPQVDPISFSFDAWSLGLGQKSSIYPRVTNRIIRPLILFLFCSEPVEGYMKEGEKKSFRPWGRGMYFGFWPCNSITSPHDSIVADRDNKGSLLIHVDALIWEALSSSLLRVFVVVVGAQFRDERRQWSGCGETFTFKERGPIKTWMRTKQVEKCKSAGRMATRQKQVPH